MPENGADLLAAGREVCDYDGHEMADMGGGVLVCMRCEHEEWEDDPKNVAARELEREFRGR